MTSNESNPNKAIRNIVIILAIFAFLALLVIVAYILTQFISPTSTNISSNIPNCTSYSKNLPDISEQECCGSGSDKYYAPLFMNLSPTLATYQSVCSQYCPPNMFNPSTNTCSSTDNLTITRFNNCIDALAPTDCIGMARPVATSKGVLYYGKSINTNTLGCLDPRVCDF